MCGYQYVFFFTIIVEATTTFDVSSYTIYDVTYIQKQLLVTRKHTFRVEKIVNLAKKRDKICIFVISDNQIIELEACLNIFLQNEQFFGRRKIWEKEVGVQNLPRKNI